MKHLFTTFFSFLSISVFAQGGNYVANSSNSSTPGQDNVLIGPLVGVSITGNGIANTFVGSNAGRRNTTGQSNSFYGFRTGWYNTTGIINSFFGADAGFNNTTGSANSFIGNTAGFTNTTGFYNCFLGSESGFYNSTGNNNTFLGNRSGQQNTIGTGNSFVGAEAGISNTTGSGNSFLGLKAGKNNTTGELNTLVGFLAGQNVTTGNNNIIIGPYSGTAISDSDDNVLMGYNSQAEDGLQNAIAIGSNSRVAVSNALILGHGVNVGIGTSAPTARLEVVSDKSDDSGLRLSSLTDNSRTAHQSDQFLTVDSQGNVVKARYQLRIQDPAQWSDKVFAPGYSLQPLPAVEAYIQKNGHLPDVPSAEEVAEKGVDLVKMNALLLQKIEELTLHMIELQKEVDMLKRTGSKN
ncbi:MULTISPECIES: hypothetical protein [unclassified Spirosoma]|uniref:hypothetical protein n=1 Tax=unclassified Spirosoma TaxID=2621999 RepID=UPI000962D4D4|nr:MULTISPECIES: hypothetical protein [unclassified Spirosoma]MBN8823573.1 hypothetical protein [Spirosoma sp.]OJW76866.1 MAG: hypothetical protein BGO59_21800 [Spirosoma sp. 48-14]